VKKSVKDMRGDVMIRTLLEWCQGAINSKMLSAMLEEKRRRRFMNKIGLRILAAQVMRNAYEYYATKLQMEQHPHPDTAARRAEVEGRVWFGLLDRTKTPTWAPRMATNVFR
jgi:hypothetical protein